MVLSILFTLIGGSIGGLLALGTAWAAVKRYLERSLARHLANGIPRDVASAIVMGKNQAGEKAIWLSQIVKEGANANEDSTILDVAGATHLELLDSLISDVKSVQIYDGKYGLQYLDENRPGLRQNEKLQIVESEELFGEIEIFKDKTFDIVLVVDVIHTIPPHQRQEAIRNWTKLASPNGGRIVVVIEEDPLTDVSQAGVVQGIFHRIHLSALKALLAAEDMSVYEVVRYPPEYRLAVVARRGQTSLAQS